MIKRIDYNAPFALTFTLLSITVFCIGVFTNGWLLSHVFSLPGNFNWANPLNYPRLLSYTLGHASVEHLIMNLYVFLLVCPLLEEKYGTKKILLIAAATGLFTGILNATLFNTGLIGASGIVFMLILLGSCVNLKKGTIPLTLILVGLLYLGGEFFAATQPSNISHFAHIVGGICGAFFGLFVLNR